MTWRRIKLFLQFSFGIFFGLLVVFMGSLMLREAKFDIRDSQQYSGRITTRSVDKFFTCTVSGFPTAFNVYKVSRNYPELEAALNPGDSVTVYFINSQTANIQVYQVEKNGQIVVNNELLTGQNRNGGIIAVIGGLVFIGGAFWRLKRKRYQFW